ncbi:MAG: hypothetical protein L6R38_005957 [Xanthoria sp. 2 TBL-2021]|nr:MAG: hypothetical protein L6R38_005957 [Xanthoria sp. 2 TBL-2021]
MVVRIPAGTSLNLEKYGITHFLRIPLATRQSRPQLRETLNQVAQDPIAAALPRDCWKHPEQLHHQMGLLRLDSPKRVREACELLNGISVGYRDVLDSEPIRKQLKYSIEIIWLTCSAASRSLTRLATVQDLWQSSAPTVALNGLHDRAHLPSYPKEARTLACNVKESCPFLFNFTWRIRDVFVAKGFIPAIKDGFRPEAPRVSIMATKFVKSDVRSEKPTLRSLRRNRTPVFDASDLHAKYKNNPWTTEFPLERMCISELGLRAVWKGGKVIRTAFRDIANVPLPGVSPDVLSLEDPDEHFVRRGYNTTPQTSLYIPSTPSS